ncbi:hypothetical protein [Algoriphagus litoralis]|uniref:hypothetical protein n=1 Tax=Algoriphagus litoralis TaxID=2202829 RepID=UPI000DB95FE0|nr:hypothetical protein [Algoriphagus litoralis]
MKKVYPFALVVVFATLISCTENDEPLSPLIGTWEKREFVDSLDLWFVDVLEFKNDSIFDLTTVVRDMETGPTLGYRMITTAWYRLEGANFTYYYSDGLFHSAPLDGEFPFYVPQSELRPGVIDFFIKPEGVLTFSSDRRMFQFQPNCFAFKEGQDCFQFPLEEYVRVN